ncbi:unnamed protein product [Brachionus calyciflorus]|uniref:Transposase n=1 Tax=Brachionus calyciflorus TaxID=104777 RepID=A0A813MYI9_9BILA|nr:unnamed protein product [Brachionus calyciflorus]
MYSESNIFEINHSNDMEKIIHFLKTNEMLLTKPPFCKSNKEMKETIKSSLSDKHVWRCTKCGEFRTIRYNSFFSQFDIRLDKILKIIFHWCLQMNHIDVKKLVGVSEPTINKIFQKIRLLCLNDLKRESFILGGEGEVVEINKSLFVRVKHNVGKDLSRQQIWVFGMYQRSNKKCLFYVVSKRDAVNLLNLIYNILHQTA